jgi:SAM-dependent methyltransferase
VWLEGVYDAVDYGSALDAAAKLPSPFGDGAADDEATTYGEFPFGFLAALLELLDPPPGARFLDLGSGRGQVALAASQLRAWRGCGGVELLPELHCIALEARRVVRAQAGDDAVNPSSPAPCALSFKLGDLYSADALAVKALPNGESSPLVVFVYATCLAVNGRGELQQLTDALAHLPPGTTVVTVNRPLAAHPTTSNLKTKNSVAPLFELLRAVRGPNPEAEGSGRLSTAFIWRKVI